MFAAAIVSPPTCLVDAPGNLSSLLVNASSLKLSFSLSAAVEVATLYAGVVSRPLLPSGRLAAPLFSAPLDPHASTFMLDLALVGGGALSVYWQVEVRGCGASQTVIADVQVHAAGGLGA